MSLGERQLRQPSDEEGDNINDIHRFI